MGASAKKADREERRRRSVSRKGVALKVIGKKAPQRKGEEGSGTGMNRPDPRERLQIPREIFPPQNPG